MLHWNGARPISAAVRVSSPSANKVESTALIKKLFQIDQAYAATESKLMDALASKDGIDIQALKAPVNIQALKEAATPQQQFVPNAADEDLTPVETQEGHLLDRTLSGKTKPQIHLKPVR